MGFALLCQCCSLVVPAQLTLLDGLAQGTPVVVLLGYVCACTGWYVGEWIRRQSRRGTCSCSCAALEVLPAQTRPALRCWPLIAQQVCGVAYLLELINLGSMLLLLLVRCKLSTHTDCATTATAPKLQVSTAAVAGVSCLARHRQQGSSAMIVRLSSWRKRRLAGYRNRQSSRCGCDGLLLLLWVCVVWSNNKVVVEQFVVVIVTLHTSPGLLAVGGEAPTAVYWRCSAPPPSVTRASNVCLSACMLSLSSSLLLLTHTSPQTSTHKCTSHAHACAGCCCVAGSSSLCAYSHSVQRWQLATITEAFNNCTAAQPQQTSSNCTPQQARCEC